MKNLNFKDFLVTNEKYGKKEIDRACKSTEANEFLIEVAKRLADK